MNEEIKKDIVGNRGRNLLSLEDEVDEKKKSYLKI